MSASPALLAASPRPPARRRAVRRAAWAATRARTAAANARTAPRATLVSSTVLFTLLGVHLHEASSARAKSLFACSVFSPCHAMLSYRAQRMRPASRRARGAARARSALPWPRRRAPRAPRDPTRTGEPLLSFRDCALPSFLVFLKSAVSVPLSLMARTQRFTHVVDLLLRSRSSVVIHSL